MQHPSSSPIARSMGLVALVAALAGAQAISPAMAQQDASEAWRVSLQVQLATEVNCTLKQVLSVTKVPLAGLDGYQGRVRCEDLREFDFSQPAPNQKFIIKLCRPTVC